MRFFDLKNIQFGTILSDIKNYLSKVIGGSTDVDQSTVFGQLLTVITSVASNLMVYIEDALTEQNKYTVQRRKSIYGLAAQSGYMPSLGSAAGAWVRVSHIPNSDHPTTVLIQDKNQLVCSQNGLFYCFHLGQPVVALQTGTTAHNTFYYVVQGQYEAQRFVSAGGDLYPVTVNYKGFLDESSIEVRVNGDLWSKEESLYDLRAFEEGYFVRYNPTGGIDIVFGNNTHGRALRDRDLIEVQYLLHDGEGGTLTVDKNTRFAFTKPIKDVDGNEVDGNVILSVEFADRESSVAGSDAESAAQVKEMIGYNSRSLVLADANNYSAFLNRFSMVGYNRTWSDPGSMVVKSLAMKNFKLRMSTGDDYFKLKDEDFVLSQQQKDSIINAIVVGGKQLAGTIYKIIDVDLWKYSMFVYIRPVAPGIDKASTTARIRRVIGEFFANINDDRYIPKSDIVRLIRENVPAADGVNVYFLSEKNETAINTGKYILAETTYDPIVGEQVRKKREMKVYAGENPNLGLDGHGNISLDNQESFPVLMGGWSWRNDIGDEVVAEPIVVTYE